MHGSSLHGEDRTTAVFDELVQNGFSIVVFAVGKTSETSDTDQVAVASHHRDSLQQVLTFVTIHDDTAFCFQFPGASIDVKHDDVHAEVHGSLLGREAGAQGVIKEDHHQGFVLTQMLILKTVVLDLLGFGKCLVQVADILYVDETFHNL